MNLAILDASAVNPGDVSWDSFRKFADLNIYPTTSPQQVTERLSNCEATLLNKIVINEEILSKCPNLKYIGFLATGYNVIDLDATKKHGICVTNIPAYSTDAVAQHVFALILNYTNQVSFHNKSVKNGDWIKAPIFCYWNKPLTELSGKTIGILGYGNIGKKVATIAKAFGMKVIVCPHRKAADIENCVSIEDLFSQSDFISLHAPLTEETKQIVNARTLSLMKNTGYLINTARGGLVNENDLSKALDEEKIAGYAADVLDIEPMKNDCALLTSKNCTLTPHLAWAPLETRQRLLAIACKNFESWINGKPENVVG